MWPLAFVAIPLATAAVSLKSRSVVWKVAEPIACASVLLAAILIRGGAATRALCVVAALLASAVGDYLLATRGTSAARFASGIGAFLFAHIGYLVFALLLGSMPWLLLTTFLAIFLPYYFGSLRRNIGSRLLSAASLLYLLLSCFALAAAFGTRLPPLSRWLFLAGIALIVVSDTVISFVEFLGWKEVEWLIHPTYYLAHLAIVFSLLLWACTS